MGRGSAARSRGPHVEAEVERPHVLGARLRPALEHPQSTRNRYAPASTSVQSPSPRRPHRKEIRIICSSVGIFRLEHEPRRAPNATPRHQPLHAPQRSRPTPAAGWAVDGPGHRVHPIVRTPLKISRKLQFFSAFKPPTGQADGPCRGPPPPPSRTLHDPSASLLPTA